MKTPVDDGPRVVWTNKYLDMNRHTTNMNLLISRIRPANDSAMPMLGAPGMHFPHFIPLYSVLHTSHSPPSFLRYPYPYNSVLCFTFYSPFYSQHSFLSSRYFCTSSVRSFSFSMSNIVLCVADCNAKFIEGLDSALEMDLAVSDDAVESSLSQKTANTLDSTGSPAVDGFQDRKGSDDPLGAFEPQPVVPFSKRPPKAVEDIYNSLPSVESLFPDWPFYPLELPQSIPKMLTWRDAEMLRRLQGWNKEISLTRVHAPGTAAHRLWNHSFEQDVKDFSEEYEAYRRNGFQTLPGEQKIANERSMPYTFGVSRYNPQFYNPEFYCQRGS